MELLITALILVLIIMVFLFDVNRKKNDSLELVNSQLIKDNLNLELKELYSKINLSLGKLKSQISEVGSENLSPSFLDIYEGICDEADFLSSDQYQEKFLAILRQRYRVANTYTLEDHISYLKSDVREFEKKISHFISSIEKVNFNEISSLAPNWYYLSGILQDAILEIGKKPSYLFEIERIDINFNRRKDRNPLQGLEFLPNLKTLKLINFNLYYSEFESIRRSDSLKSLMLMSVKIEEILGVKDFTEYFEDPENCFNKIESCHIDFSSLNKYNEQILFLGFKNIKYLGLYFISISDATNFSLRLNEFPNLESLIFLLKDELPGNELIDGDKAREILSIFEKIQMPLSVFYKSEKVIPENRDEKNKYTLLSGDWDDLPF